jgi:uncharacterized repeat protein (TIGR01451 family)
MAGRGRGLRRLGATVVVLALVTVGLQVLGAASAVAVDANDVSVDLVAAGPFTYDHDTLAGSGNLPRYGSRTISRTNGVVESLEGGDFACGDLVLFFGQVEIDASATGGNATVELDMSFLSEPTGQPGVGFTDIVSVGISPKDFGSGGGHENLDGDEAVSLTNERDGTVGSKPARLGTVRITGLDPGDTLIYQIVGLLGCAPNANPTGNLQVAIEGGTVDGARFGVGAQTIPFKKVEDISQPGLDVTKSCPAAASVGQAITYRITVSNTGNEALNNITVQDTILGSLSASFADSLAAGASETQSFQYTIRTSDPDPLVNTVTVNAVGAQTGTAVTATADCRTTTPRVDVGIDKASDAPTGGVAPGESFNYTITVTASGTAAAQGVTVSDTIPTGLTIVSATFSGGSAGSGNCTVSGQSVTCSLGDMAPGTTATVRIRVTATPAACPFVTNRATVTATNEDAGAGGNNTSPDVVVIVNCDQPPPEPGISVSIIKENDANGDGIFTNSEEAKRAGLDVPFVLVITNTGEETFEITSLTDRFEQTVIDLLLAKCANLEGVTLATGERIACSFTLNNYSPPAETSLENTVRVCVDEVTGNDTDCDQDPSIVRSAIVLGRTVTPPTRTPPGGIAFTGPNDRTLAFGALALALLVLGTGLLWAGSRRRVNGAG